MELQSIIVKLHKDLIQSEFRIGYEQHIQAIYCS